MERIYIHARISDWSGKEERIVEEAYYGPFENEDEGKIRLFDAFADQLEASGNEVVLVGATDEEMKDTIVNTREFWMAQLAELQETSNA